MAKIMKVGNKDKGSASAKADEVQKAQLLDEDEDQTEERETKTASANKKGKMILKAHKLASFSESHNAEMDDDDEVLGESRPKTAKDQNRVLGRDPNPDHSALVESAKSKMSANESGGDEVLSDEEVDAYLADERKNLMKYGSVKLTPKNLAAARKPALMAASGLDEDEDMIRVTMFETIDPAPQVGTCNVVQAYGFEKLEKGQTYLLPKVVAMVLAEGRKGALHD